MFMAIPSLCLTPALAPDLHYAPVAVLQVDIEKGKIGALKISRKISFFIDRLILVDTRQ